MGYQNHRRRPHEVLGEFGLGLDRLPWSKLKLQKDLFFVATGDASHKDGNTLILPDTQRQSKVESKVRASANNLNQSKLKVFVTPTSPTWDPGSDVTVRATYPYSISLLGVVVKSGTLTSSTTERVE